MANMNYAIPEPSYRLVPPEELETTQEKVQPADPDRDLTLMWGASMALIRLGKTYGVPMPTMDVENHLNRLTARIEEVQREGREIARAMRHLSAYLLQRHNDPVKEFPFIQGIKYIRTIKPGIALKEAKIEMESYVARLVRQPTQVDVILQDVNNPEHRNYPPYRPSRSS